MTTFDEGYAFFSKHAGIQYAGYEGGKYVEQINNEIENLLDHLNAYKGIKTSPDVLKGNLAEIWHSDTFNINAVASGSDHRTFVDQSQEFASADVSSNFGKLFGLKYYKDGTESAKQQAKSVFERFNEYRSVGGKESFDTYLQKRGFTDESILNDPIYCGQVRVIPKDQLVDACEWLRRKIAKEATIRPDQVSRYQDTLAMLSDRIRDDQGLESISLSETEAKALAKLAKEGDVSAEELKLLGVSADQVIRFEYLAKEAFKSGLSAATISLALNVAPEIYKAINHLIKTGELDENQFRRIGFAALKGGSEGFVRGSISAAITISCKSGMLGGAMKIISPSVIGMATVLCMDTMKNAFKVANGMMTRSELAQELVRELFVSTTALTTGTIVQTFIEIPVVGFMIGSFVGSVIGSFAYDYGYSTALSFCADTGFTMFGLVKQDYTLPDDVLEAIGIEVFKFEEFSFPEFQIQSLPPLNFHSRSLS